MKNPLLSTGTPPLIRNEPDLIFIPQFEDTPFAWHGIHINDRPDGKPLIFTDEDTANFWLLDFKPGFASLEPLYKRKKEST